MSVALPLDEMTTTEKLSLIEAIWESLSRHAEDVPSPAWHAPILGERESLVQHGKEPISDWEDANREIRESLT